MKIEGQQKCSCHHDYKSDQNPEVKFILKNPARNVRMRKIVAVMARNLITHVDMMISGFPGDNYFVNL